MIAHNYTLPSFMLNFCQQYIAGLPDSTTTLTLLLMEHHFIISCRMELESSDSRIHHLLCQWPLWFVLRAHHYLPRMAAVEQTAAQWSNIWTRTLGRGVSVDTSKADAITRVCISDAFWVACGPGSLLLDSNGLVVSGCWWWCMARVSLNQCGLP